MNSFRAVIDAFGRSTSFAEAIDIEPSHARVMKARNSIPPEYWPAVIAGARRAAIKGVSYELLARLAARKRQHPAVLAL